MVNSPYIVIYITCSSEKEAKKIAQELLVKRKAACINIVPGLSSFFWWQKRINITKEVLLIVKSKKPLFEDIVKLVRSLHSYTVPEIIALPIIEGDKDYLRWITENAEKKRR